MLKFSYHIRKLLILFLFYFLHFHIYKHSYRIKYKFNYPNRRFNKNNTPVPIYKSFCYCKSMCSLNIIQLRRRYNVFLDFEKEKWEFFDYKNNFDSIYYTTHNDIHYLGFRFVTINI